MKFLKKLRKICFFLSYKILRNLRSIFNIDQKIYINGNKLVLPPKHLLTLYNKLYPNYDKFLENLIKNRQNFNIIDIGANIGDTLYRILSKNNNHYYCIEADDYFFKYLKVNANNILKKQNNISIKIINELVGEELEGFLENHNGTTAKLNKEKNTGREKIFSKRLDQIVLENNIKKVDLIKVDTDGFDLNILNSGLETIKKDKPFLFFEYVNTNSSQHNQYINFISNLKYIGYNNLKIFDNYGNVLLENSSFEDNNIEKVKKILASKNIVDIFCSINL